jgi:hypothetical protein
MLGLGKTLAAGSFRHDAEGRTLIRLWGRRGATRLVPPEREAAIARFIDVWATAGIFANLAVMAVFGWPWAFAFVPLVTAVFVVGMHRLTADLPAVDAAPVDTRHDLQVRMARATGRGWRIYLLVVGVLFVAAGLWLGLRGERTGWLVAAFFALSVATTIRQMRLLRHASAAEQALDRGAQG